MVSMDNCAQNGKSCGTGWTVAGAGRSGNWCPRLPDWLETPPGELPLVYDRQDHPPPLREVKEALEGLGLADMTISKTNTGTLIAPFVNTEITEYLVLEDAFPNGRPALEKAGVYLTDRTTGRRRRR